jgi:hypothetical protein
MGRRWVCCLTLFELMVAVAMVVVEVLGAAHSLANLAAGTRLRKIGHLLDSQTLLMCSEAIGPNSIVHPSMSVSSLPVIGRTGADNPVVLFACSTSHGMSAAPLTIDFNGEGHEVNVVAGISNLDSIGTGRSNSIRRPCLRVDGWGSIRPCDDRASHYN